MVDLQHYLAPSQEGCDMTRQIQEKLERFGICHLGSGTYLVRGIRMPRNTTLVGSGSATRLLLDPTVACGAAVEMDSFCTVRDLAVLGTLEEAALPRQVGDRHGIRFLGNATVKDWGNQPRNSIISGCYATGFTGGGITCTDTGYSTISALTVSDCHICNCGVGIYISHFSEFHKFTNILADRNLYGCINNGGNNVFVNCGFNSNVTGYLIDNSHGQSNNNSHGSAIGCTFNHSDSNKGVGIMILGATVGYVFSGCQMFYSKIVVEASEGIVFNAFNYGRNMEISVTGGKLTMFTNSVFATAPAAISIRDNPLVKFSNCYTRDGQQVEA